MRLGETKRNGQATDTKAHRGTVQAFEDARRRIYWRARITLPDGECV